MSKFKHFNFEQRKLIASLLTKNLKLVEIADLLNVDPTSVSKEIKRNRVISKQGKTSDHACKHTIRFPYCCNHCKKKYNVCPFTQLKYDAKKAQKLADHRLVYSRVGLNMSVDEYKLLDKIIKEGVDDGQSIYHIVHDNPELNISVSNVYRLINTKQLSTNRMDLPYAVKYKKRKKKKDYEYKENRNINRSNHLYLDFLNHKFNNPNKFYCQLDFLGSIKSDMNSILTLTIPDLHFVLLFLVEQPNQERVTNIFNHLEEKLSIKTFYKLFPYILTDRDPCFNNFYLFETSPLTGEVRTKIFYCDPGASNQKGNVEQMNKQLRKFFPKGKTIDDITIDYVKESQNIINNTRVQSLSGATPKEAFIKIFGEEIHEIITSINI